MTISEALDVKSVGSKTTMLIYSILILCFLAVLFILGITLIKPESDNTPIILIVVGIIVPIITALLASALQQVHLAVNSRLSELVALTAKSSKAEGVKIGIAKEKTEAKTNVE